MNEEQQHVYADDSDERLVEDAISSFAQATKPTEPVIQEPGRGLVNLSYGVEVDGERRTYVEVREMNGRDEEAIAKLDPNSPNYPIMIVDTVLRHAVTSIGGVPAKADVLQRLLMGDRDLIFKEVLFATYGTTKEYEGVKCPNCQESMDLKVDLEGIIETVELEGDDPTFSVTLTDGSVAECHYPTGKDQMSVYSGKEALTQAEVNTLMLERCIDKVDGKAPAVPHKYALDLSIRNRSLLVNALAEGPSVRFKEVEVPCESCGSPLPFVLGWADLLQL